MNNENKVRALLQAGKSSEDIIKYLIMNEDYRTGPEARTALETFMTDAGLVPTKKVPMSELYKAWYKALSREDKMACTKESLRTQAVAIGMSDKSADWYARVYLLAGSLALDMSANLAEVPIENRMTADKFEAAYGLRPEVNPADLTSVGTTLEEYLAELHDAEYELLSIAKRKKFDKEATAQYAQSK